MNKEKIKPIRVQMELSNQGSSAIIFYQVLKSMYPQLKITKNKSMTKKHLDINVRWFNGTAKTIKIYRRGGYDISIEQAIHNKIMDVIGQTRGFLFHASNIKIGKPKKCSVCNGTGKSFFPKDRK